MIGKTQLLKVNGNNVFLHESTCGMILTKIGKHICYVIINVLKQTYMKCCEDFQPYPLASPCGNCSKIHSQEKKPALRSVFACIDFFCNFVANRPAMVTANAIITTEF